jgi:hypothetical protein
VVAEERRPLAGVGDGRRRLQGGDDRRRLTPRHGQELALVEEEVEEHGQAVAGGAEVLDQLVLLGVGFGQDDGVAPPP